MEQSDWMKAAFAGDLEGVRAGLLAGIDVDARTQKGMTALMMAAWQHDRVEVAEVLLEAGADLGIRQESSGWTATTFAAVNGGEKCLRLFLDQGVDLRGKEDWKALVFAVQYRSHATVRMLLEAGMVDVDARDEDRRTALARAARNSDEKMVALLLAHGAKPNLADGDGRTALHHACEKANAANVSALLAAGAQRGKKDKAGHTPVDVAKAKGRKGILRALEA